MTASRTAGGAAWSVAPLVATAVASTAIVVARGGGTARWIAFVFGWALATANAAAAVAISRRAIGLDLTRWLAWGVLGNLTRLGLLIVFVAVAARVRPLEFAVVAIGLVGGFFGWLPAEVRQWMAAGARVQRAAAVRKDA